VSLFPGDQAFIAGYLRGRTTRTKIRPFNKGMGQAVDGQSADAAFKRIEKSGASFYIITEMERLRSQARISLERAQPKQPAEKMLIDLLGDLTYQF
jgi:hypothetical protein